MAVVWVASYPRSGNTWLRFLLTHYLYGDLSRSSEVDAKIPNIHRIGVLKREAHEGTWCLCKTHYLLSKNHPNFIDTAGFIFLLRYPKDVLLSNLHYMRLAGISHVEDEKAFVREFIENRGVKQWALSGIGSWIDHAKSWLENTALPRVFLRYEDLWQSPAEGLSKVVKFLRITADEERIKRAVYSCSFERMKEMETSEKSSGLTSLFPGTLEQLKSGVRFVNAGKSGLSLSHIGEGLDAKFDETFDPLVGEVDQLYAKEGGAQLGA